MFFSDGKKDKDSYRRKLIDFYEYESAYKSFAANNLCFQYKNINDPQRFIGFLKSQHAFIYLQNYERLRSIEVIECV